MNSNFLSKLVFFILIFFPVTIIFSGFIGFFWLNSYFIFFASFLISAILFKKFYFSDFFIPKKIFLLSGLLLILLAYPVLFVTPFFPASADPTTTATVTFLTDTIPLDYQPYSPLNFGYQIGFPLLVNVFSDIFTFIPIYLWAWVLSLISGLLQLFGIFIFAKEFFKSDKIAEFSSILFFGTKLIFENFYVGEFAWILATSMMLFSFYFLLKKSNIAFLTFPVIFMLHPAVAMNSIIFFSCLFFFYLLKFNLPKLLFSLILAVPAFFLNYLPILYNLVFFNLSSSPVLATDYLTRFFYYTLTLPPWVGIIPFTIFGLGLLFFIFKKIAFTREQKTILFVFILGLLFFYLFGVLGLMLVGRVVEVLTLSILLLTASFIANIKLVNPNYLKAFKVFLLIFGIIFFFNSSILTHYRNGSKINVEAASFAIEFKKFDSELSQVMFLSNSSQKIAEYSNKVPFDLSSHYLSTVNLLYYSQKEYADFMTLLKIKESIIDGSCPECLENVNVKYIVVDRNFFKQELNYPVVFSKDNFLVYLKS